MFAEQEAEYQLAIDL